MARLKDFLAFVDGRARVLGDAEKRLLAIQRKYETYFAEVSRVRESELGQLSAHLAAKDAALPSDIAAALESARAEAERGFDEELTAVRVRREALLAEAEKVRQESRQEEAAVRQKNVDLDGKEEALKAKSSDLLARVDAYNARIRSLASGFGFFNNFFSMRRLAAERKALDDEQNALAGQIDRLRRAWAEREQAYTQAEAARQEKWTKLKTEASALQAKVDSLSGARGAIVFRTAAEKVLFARSPKLPASAPDDPKCSRCKAPNAGSFHFCRICAQRLRADRPDFEGSLAEIAELNQHHRNFSEGMRSCQELIGLVRGIKSGLENFFKSLHSMLENESRYPLPKLQIEVPAAAQSYGREFDALLELVAQPGSEHPLQFGMKVKSAVEPRFTEAAVKGFFNAMGDELSRQAKTQWRA
jgi:hypothetical protein